VSELKPHGTEDMFESLLIDPSEGQLEWTRRYEMIISCYDMDLSNFPFDEQTCYYKLGTTSENASMIVGILNGSVLSTLFLY